MSDDVVGSTIVMRNRDCECNDENAAALVNFSMLENHQICAGGQHHTNSISNVMFSRIVSKNIIRSKRAMSTTSSPFTQAVVTAMRKL